MTKVTWVIRVTRVTKVTRLTRVTWVTKVTRVTRLTRVTWVTKVIYYAKFRNEFSLFFFSTPEQRIFSLYSITRLYDCEMDALFGCQTYMANIYIKHGCTKRTNILRRNKIPT